MKEAVFAGVLALFKGWKTTVGVEVGAEAGSLAVKWRQASVDAARQGGVGGLAGERLDTNLECNTLGYIWDGENMF